MIGRLVLKYKLLEWALDTLFDKVRRNFSSFKFTLATGKRFRKIIFNGSEYCDCTILKYNPNAIGFLLFSCHYVIKGKNVLIAFMGRDLEAVNKICSIPFMPNITVDSDIYVFNISKAMFEQNVNELEDYIYIQTGMFQGDPASMSDFLFIE